MSKILRVHEIRRYW